MRLLIKSFTLIAFAVLLIGCGNAKQALISDNMIGNVQNPAMLKIAVLPFESNSLINSSEEADYIRRQVFLNLKRGGYNLVEKFVVDGTLQENDLSFPFINEISPQRLGEILGADAIIYGKVTNWNRSYLAIHASITIGAKIKLVDSRNGEILCESKYKKTDFNGLFKVPTGISSAVISPIVFVAKKDNQYRLADEVTREMMLFLVKPNLKKAPLHFKNKKFMASNESALKELREWSEHETINYSLFEEELVAKKESEPELLDSKLSKSVRQNSRELPALPRNEEVANHSTTAQYGNSKKRNKNYTIQMGSYLLKDSAEKAVRNLLQSGMNSFISKARIKGRTWHRVQVKTFESIREAKQFAAENIDKEKNQYFITPLTDYSGEPVG